MEIAIAPDLRGRVRLGTLTLQDVTVTEADPALTGEIEACGRELRERFGSARSGDVPGVEDARALYKALGIDPTKTRPSSEALLRRVLRGESLYVVNTLVDAVNLCSLRALLPFGLYDVGHVSPPIILRWGAAGESYEGIRKAPVNLEGRPTLADAHGPFGNPTSDSARTMVTTATRSALVIVYAPAACADTRLDAVLDLTDATLRRHAGGVCAGRRLL